MISFNERLKQALDIRKMSAAELSRLSGIDEGTLSNYKKGKYEPKQRKLESIAVALNVSIPWLMGADVPMERKKEKSDIFPPNLLPVPKTVKKPRLGVISCGEPIATEENFDGYDDVPEDINCDFTLKCEGDSMIGARIHDGDIVYIKQQSNVEYGQIAAVLVDGCETLLKKVYINEDNVVLQAANPEYPPKIFYKEDMNRISIIGIAVGFYSRIKY